MGNETKKSHSRRNGNGDYQKFFTGVGIDIGCGNDPINPPFALKVISFDKKYGNDAYDLSDFKYHYFDFVYSSHCLEHLEEPEKALREWWRVLKPGGHLIVVVPEYTLYEKRHQPSEFNSDHKSFFTMENLYEYLKGLPGRQVLRLQINDDGFDYNDKVSDQTQKGAQAEIEAVIKKPLDPYWGDL